MFAHEHERTACSEKKSDFSSLPPRPAALANLERLGYTAMTPIQAASLPPALAGKDARRVTATV
jgi:superfamily II DNA/RNA helicase